MKIFLSFIFMLVLPVSTVFAYSIADLSSRDESTRMHAAQEMGNTRVAGSAAGLIDLLKDKSTKVRIAAVVSLGMLKDASAIDPLIDTAKKDKEMNVRLMAVQALGKFNDERINQALSDSLNDKDARIRQVSCTSMGRTGNEKEVSQLIDKADKDDDSVVRQRALEALGDIVEAKSLSIKSKQDIKAVVTKARGDRNGEVGKRADDALKRVKRALGEKQ